MRISSSLGSVVRALAIGIAIVAVVDPAVTSRRDAQPTIALAVTGAHDSALADRVSRALSKKFIVVRASIAAAAGTVIVGDRLPSDPSELASPAFAVLADPAEHAVTIVAAHAPSIAPPSSRVSIAVTARAIGVSGRAVEFALRAGGVVVDRVSHTVRNNDETVPVSLSFVPTATGRSPLRITAGLSGSRNPAAADLFVDVLDKRWPVLFFDPRPSWMSTFVRRAIERDPRFEVTSRVVTSRSVTTDAGRPPARLDDLATTAPFDAIVVGAPEMLTATDVSGLDAFLRRRGGAVVLLFDQRAPGAYERLTTHATWNVNTDSTVVPIALGARDTGALRASEVMWPQRLPLGAVVIGQARGNENGSALRPIVWRSSVGAGRLVVSGALDAWRFRDRSHFDDAWRTLIAESVSGSPPPIDARLSNATPRPGEQVAVDVTVRDVALQDATAAPMPAPIVAARLESIGGASQAAAIAMWPDETAGQYRGIVRAPDIPGLYNVIVSAGAGKNEATVPLLVAAGATHPEADDRDLVASWVATHGGHATPASRVAELPAALARAIHPAARVETWHPMRSAWWIVPFAIFLSAEWWIRRRNGFA
jgi:hypothetical protein